MKKILFIMILIFTCSCKNENPYKKAFEEKIKENIKSRNQTVDYKLLDLKYKADEQPVKYNEIYLFLYKLNNICNSFVDKSLKIKDINKLNKIRENTVRKIKNLTNDYPEVQKITSELNKPITNHLDKFECIEKVNKFYFSVLRIAVDSYSSPDCGSSIYSTPPKPTRVYSYRVNDSLVSILVANNSVVEFPVFFNSAEKYFHFEFKSPNDKYLECQKSDCIVAYDVYTTSDTLNLKATIRTNKNIGLVLTDDEKNIVVGGVVELKTNCKEFKEIILDSKYKFRKKNE